MKLLFRLGLLVAGVLLSHSAVVAQSDNLRAAVASMSQDMNILAQQLKTLRLDMEEMRRENAQLRAQVTAATSNSSTETRLNSLTAAIEAVRREYRQADAVQKEQIIAEVSRQIEALGRETQDALNSVAKAIDSTPRVSTPVHFSEDYPKTGTTYTVRAGDTLSKIARDHGSTTKHIQNANKIANPARDLKVGEVIFIPISQ